MFFNPAFMLLLSLISLLSLVENLEGSSNFCAVDRSRKYEETVFFIVMHFIVSMCCVSLIPSVGLSKSACCGCTRKPC